jgi:hypothetical protein
MTRKLLLLCAVLIVVGLAVALYPAAVEKPVKDGSGPNAVTIAARYPAPPYHTPLDRWQTHHMEAVNRGDLAQADCLYCHVPAQSCNNCHSYVGVDPIAAAGSAAAGAE